VRAFLARKCLKFDSRICRDGDGRHRVFLDGVLVTMRQAGADMQSKYKERARGLGSEFRGVLKSMLTSCDRSTWNDLYFEGVLLNL
jgi:hypothetical protein